MPVSHDDGAFGYFLMTLLVFYAVPATYFWARRVASISCCKPKVEDEVRPSAYTDIIMSSPMTHIATFQARTSAESAKVARRLAKRTQVSTLATPGFILMTVFLLLSYIGMYYAYGNIMANAAIKQWNPYEVRFIAHLCRADLVPHLGLRAVAKWAIYVTLTVFTDSEYRHWCQ